MSPKENASNLISFNTTFAFVSEVLNKIKSFIITKRGAAILVFLTYLLCSPVLKETDIIAAVIVYTLGSIILILIITTYVYGEKIKNSATISAFQPESFLQVTDASANLSAVSNVKSIFLMKVENISVPPGFYLELRAELTSDSVQPSKHIITGKIKNDFRLEDIITFPHRGYWRIKKISFTFSDKMNLTAYHWSVSDNIGTNELLVIPREFSFSNLPVLSSSSRSGETVPDTKDKNGDLLDLKQYHPSDGMRRILWKVYAKSGELISRHPEASITPEGQVLIYALAGKYDEEVCSAALAYIKILEKLNLEIIFSCYGAFQDEVATDYNSVRELLIDTVWNTEDESEINLKAGLQNIIDNFYATDTTSKIEKIIIFTGRDHLYLESYYNKLVKIGEYLEKLSIMPVFFIICEDGIQEPQKTGLIQRLFTNTDRQDEKKEIRRFQNFLTYCKNKNWEFELENI